MKKVKDLYKKKQMSLRKETEEDIRRYKTSHLMDRY
jgi:hypothetical protein